MNRKVAAQNQSIVSYDGHRPRKRFGQNFLIDNDVVVQIIQVMQLKKTDHVVEIGPGLGVLTKEIVDKVACYDAIEIDRDLSHKLQATYNGRPGFTLHCADALAFDFHVLQRDNKESLRFIGNLPYNITTPLLFHVMQYSSMVKDMYFMVQREVADRLVSEPGSKDYGRLSVMMQYSAKIEKLFDVAPSAFLPSPQVYSSFVRVIPLVKRDFVASDEQNFADIVQNSFNHRRKTIHNSLKGLVSDQQWQDLGIDPQLRPEQLSLKHFVMISNIIGRHKKGKKGD